MLEEMRSKDRRVAALTRPDFTQSLPFRPPPSAPRVIRVKRRRRYRSLENQHQQLSTTKARSITIIHAAIRPPRRTHPTNHQSANPNENLLPVSKPKKPSIIQSLPEWSKHATSSVAITSVRRRHRSLSHFRRFSLNNNDSSKNLQQPNNRPSSTEENATEGHTHRTVSRSKIDSSKVTSDEDLNITNRSTVKLKDAWSWPDAKDFSKDHRRNRKKNQKKSCQRSRRCVIAFFVAAFLLAIAIAVLLIALLIKRTNTTATNLTAVIRWSSSRITIASAARIFSNASNYLNVPFGLIVDPFYTLYIADWSNNRVQQWKMGASNGTTVAGQATGVSGSTSSTFFYPGDVVLDSSGDNIYVADSSNNRVQFWLKNAFSGTTVAGTGVSGSANNQLNRPFSVVRDPSSGTLYISETLGHRVMSYLSGASSGTIVAGNGTAGTSSTQLQGPSGLYFDSFTNSLIIANAGANNIVRWVLGASSWTLVAGDINGLSGYNSTLLNAPNDVTLDPMGNVYVADTNNHRVQFFLAGQTNGTTIAGMTGINSINASLLSNPYGLTLDNQLNLYVSDSFHSRVQKFLRY